MFKENDNVIIKTLDVLIKDGSLKKHDNMQDVYYNENHSFIVFPDFNFYGKEATIIKVDNKDPEIPYFLSIGIWVPEFMISTINIPEDEDKNINNEQVYINKYNNKPFGKLFIKLIKLDAKISEFSSTAFSKLKKHELQYIAKLLQNNGAEYVDYNKLTQKDLAKYCFDKASKL